MQIHFDSIRVNSIPQVSAIIIFYPYRCINCCVYILKYRLFHEFHSLSRTNVQRDAVLPFSPRSGPSFYAKFQRNFHFYFPSTIASYPFTRSHEPPPGSFFLSSSFFFFFFFHHDRLSSSRNCATTEIGSHHLDGEILFRISVSTILCNWKIC